MSTAARHLSLVVLTIFLWGGVYASAAPQVVVEGPTTKDFGTLNLGLVSPDQSFTIKNTGDVELTIKSVALVGGQSGDFVLNKTGILTKLAAGTDKTSITVSFKPKAVGARATTLRISTSDPTLPYVDIGLSGTAKKNTAPLIYAHSGDVESNRLLGTATVDLSKFCTVVDPGELSLSPVFSFDPSEHVSTIVSFHSGPTWVKATYTDSGGIKVSTSFTVNVRDTTPPVFTSVPKNIALNATSPAGALVFYPPASATDSSGVEVSYSVASGSFFPVGVTRVKVTATDYGYPHHLQTERAFDVVVHAPALVVERNGFGAVGGNLWVPLIWGKNTYGQTNAPTAVSTGVIAISAGSEHTVALKLDGGVVAWGRNTEGQTTVPTSAQTEVKAISAGWGHTVALRTDGSVVAWGLSSSGQTTVPAAATSGIVAVSAGNFHTMALDQSGRVSDWGKVRSWLSSYSSGPAIPVVPLDAERDVMAIAAGGDHSVALKRDGRVIAWGWNSYGQITVPPSAESEVVAIAAGESHTVALRKDGSVIAWGDNQFGQITVPLAAQSKVIAIDAGAYHTAAVREDGSVVTWGDSGGKSDIAVPSPATSGITAISAGRYHTVGLKAVPNTTSQATRLPLTNVGSQFHAPTFWIRNSGSAPLSIASVNITGDDASDFSIDTSHTSTSLQPGDSTTFDIAFAPTVQGLRGAIVRILTNAPPTGSVDLPIFGTGKINTAPILHLPTSPVVAEAIGSNGASVCFNVGVTDAGEPASLTPIISQASGSLFPIGETTVNVSATDADGLISTGSFVVRVQDKTPPLIKWPSGISIPLESPTGTHVTVPEAEVTDAVGVALVEYEPIKSFFAPGVTVIRVRAADTAGNVSYDYYSVCVGVILTVPTSPVIAEATGSAGAVVNFNVGVSVGSVPAVTGPTATPASGTTFPMGDTTVNVTATDSSGFPSLRRSFTVSVRDTRAPRIEPLADLSVAATQVDGAFVTYPGGVATDAVGVTSLTYSKESSTFFPVGSTTVTATASDAAGNKSTGQFRVTVAKPVPRLAIQRQGAVTPDVWVPSQVVAWGSNTWEQTDVPALMKPVSIAAGGSHTLALRQDGRVIGWGAGGRYYQHPPAYGQTTPPANLVGVVDIAAGDAHSAALTHDGSVVCWGIIYGGTLQPPQGLKGVVGIAAGSNFMVALKQDGAVVAWGNNYYGQTNVPVGLSDVVAIAAGQSHAVALKRDGSVVAWGSNTHGEVTVPSGLNDVTAIFAGGTSTFAVKNDRSIVSWGSYPMPSGISELEAFAGANYCAAGISRNGNVAAWGSNYDHQLDVPSGLRNVVSIAVGGAHVVALSGVRPIPFGTHRSGEVADQTMTLQSLGALSVENLSVQLTGLDKDQFSIVGPPVPSALAPGSQASLTVRFKPRGVGRRNATLVISSNSAGMPVYEVQLSALAVAPVIELYAPSAIVPGSSISFERLRVDETPVARTITIRNSGGVDLEKSGGHEGRSRQ